MSTGSARRFWRVKLQVNQEHQGLQGVLDEVVRRLWPVLAGDGIDPVEGSAADALVLLP